MGMVNCTICGHYARPLIKGIQGFRAGLNFDLYNCGICDSSFANPLEVDADIYNQIYANSSKLIGYNRYLEYATNIVNQDHPLSWLSEREPVYEYVANFLRMLPAKPQHILEVGSGYGYLTFALNREGYQAQGIDISEQAVESARRRYGNFYRTLSLEQVAEDKAKYELIIALELIEHVVDPLKFLLQARQLLKPGGRILITTPNKDAFLNDDIWTTDLPPVHLWWFSAASMRFLADRANMEVEFLTRKSGNTDKNRHFGAPLLSANGDVLQQPGLMNRLSLITDCRLTWLKQMRRQWLFARRQYLKARHMTCTGSDILTAVFTVT